MLERLTVSTQNQRTLTTNGPNCVITASIISSRVIAVVALRQ
jgi:hypothetical protein